VIDIAAQDVKNAPDLGASTSGAYVRGLIPVAGRMVVLLDIELLLGAEFSANTAIQAA
jgi:purine-binding chemotaxis protein CheW